MTKDDRGVGRENRRSAPIGRLALWILFALVFPFARAGASSPAQAVLASPLNATFAADHADEWVRRGVRGFLFDGIMDDVSTDVWAVDGDTNTQGEEDRLLIEVRDANRRLVEKGIDHSYIAATFTTDRPYFSETALWGYMEDRFAAAGQFCRLADLRGIALRCRITNLFYQYQWDGYRYQGYSAEDLGYGATEFGKRMAAAFLREAPNADILLIADDWRDGGPLWLRMLEGFVSAFDRQPNATIHVLPQTSLKATPLDQYPVIVAGVTNIVKARFAPENWQLWKEHGGVTLGLQPFQRDRKTGAPRESYPLETYRTLLAGAKVFSSTTVCIDDPDACWWTLSDEDAKKYAGLLQKPPRPKANGSPANLSAYSAATPLDAFDRVGESRIADAPCVVLASNAGAAAFLWRGTAKPMSLASRLPAIPSTDIATAEKRTLALENPDAKIGPFLHPTLLEGLPVREFVLPASLTCEIDDTPSPGAKSVPIRYGFVNHTQFRLEGRLDALAPVRMAVDPPGQDFALEAGEHMTVDGALVGSAALGEPVAIRLSLAVPGAAPVIRSFDFATGPAPVWTAKALGPIPAAPLLVPVPKSSDSDVVVCTSAGEVLWFDASGERTWRRDFPSVFAAPPVLGRDWFGAQLVAVADRQGKVRVLKTDGALHWEFSFDSPCSQTGIVYADLHPFPGAELVAGLEDGRVCAVINDGFPYWTFAMEGRNALLAPLPPGNDGMNAIAAVADSGQIVVLEHDGAPRWTAKTDVPIDCPPLFVTFGAKEVPSIVTASRKGVIQVRDAQTGALIFKAAPKGLQKAVFLVGAGTAGTDKLAFVAGDGASVFGLSREFSVLWQAPIACVSPPASLTTNRGRRILVPSVAGALVCLDGAGRVHWSDARSGGPVLAAPQILRADSKPAVRCVYASTDGVLRCVTVD